MRKPETCSVIAASAISAVAVIIAALIGYLGLRAQIETPINATRTAIAETYRPTEAPIFITQISPHFTIANKLALAIEISVDGISMGSIESYSTKTFVVNQYPVRVTWEVIKQAAGEGRIGHDMSGAFDSVTDGESLTIDNFVVDQLYFYPIITNNTDKTCSVIINEGNATEYDTGASVGAYHSGVGFGYYKLFTNSNVTLNCDGEFFWWGNRPGETETNSAPLADFVQQETGVIELTHSP